MSYGVKSINLGFKSKLLRSPLDQSIRTNTISTIVKTHVDFYVESWVEIHCKRIFEYVQVVPFPRDFTGLHALFCDDQVVMHPIVTTLPSLSFPFIPFSLSLSPSTLS